MNVIIIVSSSFSVLKHTCHVTRYTQREFELKVTKTLAFNGHLKSLLRSVQISLMVTISRNLRLLVSCLSYQQKSIEHHAELFNVACAKFDDDFGLCSTHRCPTPDWSCAFRRPVRTAARNCMFKNKIQFTVHSNDIAVSMFAVRQASALSAWCLVSIVHLQLACGPAFYQIWLSVNTNGKVR